ncbi:MAG: histidine kinase N-terminal 7TM domain-containing protein, partial [Thiobacillus sp.]
FEHGVAWYFNWVFQYITILAGMTILIRRSIQTKGRARWSTVLACLSMLIPWVGNIIYVFVGAKWLGGADISVLLFGITGIIIFIAISRFDFFSITPMAISAIYKDLSVGIIIFDKNKNIVDFNAISNKYLNKKTKIGEPLSHLDIDNDYDFSKIVSQNKEDGIFQNDKSRWLQISADNLKNENGALIGYSLLMFDVTKQMEYQVKLDAELKKASKLNDIMVSREMKMIELKNRIRELDEAK